MSEFGTLQDSMVYFLNMHNNVEYANKWDKPLQYWGFALKA